MGSRHSLNHGERHTHVGHQGIGVGVGRGLHAEDGQSAGCGIQTLCALVCMSCARVNKTYYEAISVKRPVPQAVQDAQAALHSAYLPTGGNLWCLRQRLEAYCAVRA
jgi:hypothetical protein